MGLPCRAAGAAAALWLLLNLGWVSGQSIRGLAVEDSEDDIFAVDPYANMRFDMGEGETGRQTQDFVTRIDRLLLAQCCKLQKNPEHQVIQSQIQGWWLEPTRWRSPPSARLSLRETQKRCTTQVLCRMLTLFPD